MDYKIKFTVTEDRATLTLMKDMHAISLKRHKLDTITRDFINHKDNFDGSFKYISDKYISNLSDVYINNRGYFDIILGFNTKKELDMYMMQLKLIGGVPYELLQGQCIISRWTTIY